MKVSDIASRVRSIAGDQLKIQVEDPDIYNWVNDAMREIAADNQLLQKTGTTPVVQGTNKYSIPADILKLHSVRFDGNDLKIITLEDAKDNNYLNSDQGTPNCTWVWASNFILYPTPSAAGILEIDYIRNPTEVTDMNAIPEVPTSYHIRIVDYCLAQIAQQDDDMNRYNLKMDEFRTGVTKLKDQPEWEINEYPYIGVADRDSGSFEYGDGLW